MKLFLKIIICISNIIVLPLMLSNFSIALTHQSECNDILERGHLNVLTINLLFSEFKDREKRLSEITEFIALQEEQGEPVDIILLQEIVGGLLSGTINSSLDLQTLLTKMGLKYNLRYRLANGLLGLFSVGNAILSRCEVEFTISKTLPFESEEAFEGIEIPLKRKIMMSRIILPSSEKINVYNTHLCAFCESSDRLEQTEVALKFVQKIENFFSNDNPIILGGDFNTNLNIDDQRGVYDLITLDNEFVDTYADANGCFECCPEDDVDGCTYAVSSNPYTDQSYSERIDYIFIKGMEVLQSNVVFNSEPWVSDHSGVLTRISLP